MRHAIRLQAVFIIFCLFILCSCGKTSGDVTFNFDGARAKSVSITIQNGKYKFKGYVTRVLSMPESASRSFASAEAKSSIIQAVSKYLGVNDQQWLVINQFRIITLTPTASNKFVFTAESYAKVDKRPPRSLATSDATETTSESLVRAIKNEELQNSFSPSSDQGSLLGAFQETRMIIEEAFKDLLRSQKERMARPITQTPNEIERFTNELEALHQFMKEDISKDIRLNDIVDRPELYKLLDIQLQETFDEFVRNTHVHKAYVK
jgi:hypothetical protein